jgi:hypothetical protein
MCLQVIANYVLVAHGLMGFRFGLFHHVLGLGPKNGQDNLPLYHHILLLGLSSRVLEYSPMPPLA